MNCDSVKSPELKKHEPTSDKPEGATKTNLKHFKKKKAGLIGGKERNTSKNSNTSDYDREDSVEMSQKHDQLQTQDQGWVGKGKEAL